MTARLVFIACAETTATRSGAFPSDDRLDRRGRAAAVAARTALPRHDHAATSPSVAAQETAAALGLAATIDEALRDLDVGSWAGRDLVEIAATDPGGAAAFVADPAFVGHGGEAIEGCVGRLARWLDARIADRGATVVVAQRAILRAAHIAALGAPAQAFWRLDVAPLGTVSLTSDGRRWAVRLPGIAKLD